jgi:hypothetical protein
MLIKVVVLILNKAGFKANEGGVVNGLRHHFEVKDLDHILFCFDYLCLCELSMSCTFEDIVHKDRNDIFDLRANEDSNYSENMEVCL